MHVILSGDNNGVLQQDPSLEPGQTTEHRELSDPRMYTGTSLLLQYLFSIQGITRGFEFAMTKKNFYGADMGYFSVFFIIEPMLWRKHAVSLGQAIPTYT